MGNVEKEILAILLFSLQNSLIFIDIKLPHIMSYILT